ncbi:hypothetical protein ACPW96_16745 [Micromonospora sp. DT81.3]|uniref:hypothetical protein n=1 Tax=Micromonospora sp. DT81.3 TaxID=3416523 RepID=UPI003CF1E5D2
MGLVPQSAASDDSVAKSVADITTGDQKGSSATWADAVDLQDPWRALFDRESDPGGEIIDRLGERLDSLCQEPDRAADSGNGAGVSGFIQPRASANKLFGGQPVEGLPHGRVGRHDEQLEQVDRLGAGLDRRVVGHLEDP